LPSPVIEYRVFNKLEKLAVGGNAQPIQIIGIYIQPRLRPSISVYSLKY